MNIGLIRTGGPGGGVLEGREGEGVDRELELGTCVKIPWRGADGQWADLFRSKYH